jgi:hypothetical protein
MLVRTLALCLAVLTLCLGLGPIGSDPPSIPVAPGVAAVDRATVVGQVSAAAVPIAPETRAPDHRGSSFETADSPSAIVSTCIAGPPSLEGVGPLISRHDGCRQPPFITGLRRPPRSIASIG